MKRVIVYMFLCSCFLYSCASFFATSAAIEHLRASQAVNHGVSSMPYFINSNMSLTDINNYFIEAKMKVTLADTYKSAYGVDFKDVDPSGNTGYKVPTAMDGSKNLQRILKDKGMPDADHYILTSIDSQKKNGYRLLAVVYRPYDTIKLKYGNDKSNVKVLTSQNGDFYEPYQTDADGKELDIIIDWAGVPNDTLEIQKYRAVMLTLAANHVFEKKTCDDYWEAQILWLEGKYGVMCNKRDQEMCALSESKKIQ